ncbi:MAG: DUF1211 domain-containing protein [Mesorhizobium sp.]|uniref:TMEM175 family protein n=1 Tax=Mesorhizobium sp. TaxID=1871066 RepID=UPI0012064035|nr:TMEM175 family protein [Mesorhizobium sp.]TIL59393.1 MAG: DUF1211 domain-containing protein [Mesorhizobium sp.]
MGKGRVEAFSDGVMAIIITIMVLELKVPHSADFSGLAPLWPTFLSYVLSFIYVGIYWNNLHNMFHIVQRVDGRVLWANLHLLFWLSLMPVTTAFMGENHFAPVPVAVYGVVLALCAAAYFILVVLLHRLHGNDTAFARGAGTDRKEKISVVLYIAAIPLTSVNQWISFALYVLVAMIWFVPDKRFERQIEK